VCFNDVFGTETFGQLQTVTIIDSTPDGYVKFIVLIGQLSGYKTPTVNWVTFCVLPSGFWVLLFSVIGEKCSMLPLSSFFVFYQVDLLYTYLSVYAQKSLR
jgi:hypothetical protein